MNIDRKIKKKQNNKRESATNE